uniref:DUF5592 family protein n=1 Tax=Carnobacterium sp. TaxID=48221 RepID=UPI00345024CB
MNFQNPKSTKQEIKLWAFYLLDIGIIVGMVMIASYITRIIPLSPLMEMFYYIASAIFGIYLCVRTPNHPTDRNIKVLVNLLKMDKNNYHSIEI